MRHLRNRESARPQLLPKVCCQLHSRCFGPNDIQIAVVEAGARVTTANGVAGRDTSEVEIEAFPDQIGGIAGCAWITWRDGLCKQ
jgi:hypothetical protein